MHTYLLIRVVHNALFLHGFISQKLRKDGVVATVVIAEVAEVIVVDVVVDNTVVVCVILLKF